MLDVKSKVPIVLCVILLGRVMGDPIDFSDCGSDYEIKKVDIEGCKYIPCKLQIGNSYKFNMTLKPKYRSQSLTQEVFITLWDIVDIPVDVTPDNPCFSLSCPIDENKDVNLTSTFLIGDDFMAARGMLWWKMRTNTNKSAVCMKTTVKIENRRHKYSWLKPSIAPTI